MKYCKDDGHLIRMAVDGARKLQPIVVLKYNLAWLVANPEGMNHILMGFWFCN